MRDTLTPVVLLAGGLGTRLRQETEFRPKPLVEVGGKPLIWHIMKLFAHHGHSRFVICTGYKGELIKDYFLNYASRNNDFTIRLDRPREVQFHDRQIESEWEVTVADTGPSTQTGGRIKRVRPYLGDRTVMITYGDGVADIDINALLRFHRGHGKLATLTTVRPVSRYGVLDLDDNGNVRRFREKPTADGWVNAGFFVFEPLALDYLLGDDSVLEEEPLQELAKNGELAAFRHEGFFQPMDTYREVTLLNDLWAQGAPWRVWK